MTAADVVFSLDEARSDTGASAEDFASVSAVTAVDDATVEITLTQPDNELEYNLTRRGGAVVRAGATDLESTANGTGPFTLTDWSVGSSITLERYDAYWGDPATVAEVTFLYFTDPNAAINALTTGDADILTGVNTDLVGPLEDDPGYVVNEGTTNGEITLGFNNSRAPLDNRDVRMAIRQAIDKQGVRELYNGYGTIIGGPVPPTDAWYEDLTDVAPYDPDAARSLLEGAGVAAGTRLRLVYPNIYPTNLAEYIASQLGDVGLEVEIQSVEFSVWLEQVYTNADYDMTVVLHVEPRDITNYANPDYYWRYDNPDVQQLIADARIATDADTSVDLLRQAARQIAEDSPVDWLLLYADLTVSTTDVSGYPTDDTASRFDASGITVAG
jgi:peptide/nickel transport system substrate-binding protein